MSSVRENLIIARKNAGLTQQQLSEKVGISRAFLTNIELGKYTPSLKVASEIAIFLEKDISELFIEHNVHKKHEGLDQTHKC